MHNKYQRIDRNELQAFAVLMNKTVRQIETEAIREYVEKHLDQYIAAQNKQLV
jgi:DNA-binding protein Fis